MADFRAMGQPQREASLKLPVILTLGIIIIPIGLYFSTKSIVFEGMMSMTSTNSYFYAAIVAILAVHFVLGLFIYVAWTEDAPPAAPKLADKTD